MNFRFGVVDEAYQASAEEVLARVRDHTVRRLHGDMGWLNNNNTPTQETSER